MTFMVQHGYGKGDKITAVGARGHLTGTILSAGDEDPESLRIYAQRARSEGQVVLLDPQSYVYSTNPPGAGKRHGEHGLNLGTMKWSQTPQEVRRAVQAVEHANVRIGTQELMIAPTCFQQSLEDIWTPLALQFARSAAEEWGSNRTYATLCFDQGALSSWSTLENWLDVATTLDVRGFYLLVDRRGSYPNIAWDSQRLTNLLRLIYVLTELNGYEAIWGYSDIEGQLGLAVGATSIATGWFYGLRNFNVSKWQPSTSSGGTPAIPRLHVGRLWASMRAPDEVKGIASTSLAADVLPGRIRAMAAGGGLDAMSLKDAQIQHMTALARRSDLVKESGDASARLQLTLNSLLSAQHWYELLADEGVALPPGYKTRVGILRESLEKFKELESL